MLSLLEFVTAAEQRIRASSCGGTVLLVCRRPKGQQVVFEVEAGERTVFRVDSQEVMAFCAKSCSGNWVASIAHICRVSGFGSVELRVVKCTHRSFECVWLTTTSQRDVTRYN